LPHPNHNDVNMSYQPGQLILNDKYRIEALVGKGAFAEVYRATHLALNAERAIKALHRNTPGLGSMEYDDFIIRFQQEAQLGNRLDHPNIIRVYDFEQEQAAFLLVMEYAKGGSLQERIELAHKRNELIAVIEALQIGVDVAQGLSALHAMDVVHRDLKPTNILFDEKNNAKVADLGLAQLPGGPSKRSKLSKPEPHPGTPGYMSPEQENGGRLLRPASDVYALGIVLFELLTRRNYYYLKPGTRLRGLRPDAPEWLDDLLVRMLATDPQVRPWDGAEAAKLLRQGLELEKGRHAREVARRTKKEKARQAEQARLQHLAEEKKHRDEQERQKFESAAQAKRDAEEKARLQAEVTRLSKAGQSAIREQNWERTEQLAGKLAGLGEAGKKAAAQLLQQLKEKQAMQEAKRLVRLQAEEQAKMEEARRKRQAPLDKPEKTISSRVKWRYVVLALVILACLLLAVGGVAAAAKFLTQRSATQTAIALTLAAGPRTSTAVVTSRPIATETTFLIPSSTPRPNSTPLLPTNTPQRPTATPKQQPSNTPIPPPTKTSALPTSVPPTSVPPTSVPPTSIPPTTKPPTSIPPTSIPQPTNTPNIRPPTPTP
jgi:tRNA A-37 threonylcarbamoyl transferase component Bud32